MKGSEASHDSATYYCIIMDNLLIFIHIRMHALINLHIHSFIHSTNVYRGLTLGQALCYILGLLR